MPLTFLILVSSCRVTSKVPRAAMSHDVTDNSTDDVDKEEGEKGKRDRDVTVRFRASKSRAEVRRFLQSAGFPLTSLVGISQLANRWVDFTCTNVEAAMLLKHKARFSKEVRTFRLAAQALDRGSEMRL